MSDPFSISAGIVGVVTATAHVIRKTIDLIDKIEDAPSLVYQIRSELDHTEPVIRSLEKRLESSVETVAWAQLFEESKLSKALDTTRTVCENFASALRKWTRHSPPGNKLSLRDGFAIAIHGSKIAQLMKQLNSCKLTVTMALTSCAVQGQMQDTDQAKRTAKLKIQERDAVKLLDEQRNVLNGLRSEERQLQIVKTQSEDTGDIGDVETVEEALRDVSRARIAISQFATVSEYVAKSSVASQTNQDIGKVVIADLGYGAIGISNVDEVSSVKQKIGDVSVGSGGTGFIGIHNKVDHNVASSSRWSPTRKE